MASTTAVKSFMINGLPWETVRIMKTPISRKLNRREFVAAGTGAGVLASGTRTSSGPQVISRGVKPVVVSAANGNRSKDSAGVTCVAKAFNMITSGADVLDACIAG